MLNCDKIIYRDATHYYTEYSSIVPDRDSLSVVRQECLCSKRCLWPELMTSRKDAEPPNKKKNLFTRQILKCVFALNAHSSLRGRDKFIRCTFA
jgi:hypothetical protein